MNPNTASVPKNRKLPIWVKIILIVIVVLVLFFVGVFIFTNLATRNAVKVSDQFVADIQANNETAAYSLTNSGFRQSTSEQQLTDILNQASPALQGKATITAKAINKVSGRPNVAVIVYSVSTSDGTKYIRVVLQDDHPWQVYNFRSSNTRLDANSTN